MTALKNLIEQFKNSMMVALKGATINGQPYLIDGLQKYASLYYFTNNSLSLFSFF